VVTLVGVLCLTGVALAPPSAASVASSVTTPAVTVAPSSAVGARSGYTIVFSTSATGGLSAAAGSTVTIIFPTGTSLIQLSGSSLTDTTTNKLVGFANSSGTTTATFFLYSGSVVNAGDALSAVIGGAVNPTVASSVYTVKVSTSSDIAAATSCPYYIGAGPAGPCVKSLSPNSGPLGGGTTVKITGLNLTGATAVKFGATAAASFTVNSATLITAVSPAGTGTVDVTVTNPTGTSPKTPGDRFKYLAPPKITTTSLPGGVHGSAYSATLKASGGKTPYTWSISAGSLPAGLTLSASTGVISGTPTTAGTSNFTVRVTDSESPTVSATKALSITIT